MLSVKLAILLQWFAIITFTFFPVLIFDCSSSNSLLGWYLASMMTPQEKEVDEPEARVDDTSEMIITTEVDIPLVTIVEQPPGTTPTDDVQLSNLVELHLIVQLPSGSEVNDQHELDNLITNTR